MPLVNARARAEREASALVSLFLDERGWSAEMSMSDGFHRSRSHPPTDERQLCAGRVPRRALSG